MNDLEQNKNRYRDKKIRKNRDRPVNENQRTIVNKPAREKRWKEKYVAGELMDEESSFDMDGEDFESEEDSDEESTE